MKKVMIIFLAFIMLEVSLFATGIDVEYGKDLAGGNEFLEFEINQNVSIYKNFGIDLELNFNSKLKNNEIILNKDFKFLGGVSYKDMLFYFKKDMLIISPIIGIQKKSSLYKNFGIELIIPYIHYYYENDSVYFQEKKSIIFKIEDQINLNIHDSSFFIKEEIEFSKIDFFKKNTNQEESVGSDINISIRNKIGFQSGYFKIGISNVIKLNSKEETKLDLNNLQIFIGFKF